jgi:hypothetical protein
MSEKSSSSIPARDMTKGIHRYRARKLALDPMQQVEVERCCRALCVIVCRQENILILGAIDADQQHRATPRVAAIIRSKSTAVGATRFPIVDPGKKASLGALSTASGKAKLRLKSPFSRRLPDAKTFWHE